MIFYDKIRKNRTQKKQRWLKLYEKEVESYLKSDKAMYDYHIRKVVNCPICIKPIELDRLFTNLSTAQRTDLINRFCYGLERELRASGIEAFVSPNFFYLNLPHKKIEDPPYLYDKIVNLCTSRFEKKYHRWFMLYSKEIQRYLESNKAMYNYTVLKTINCPIVINPIELDRLFVNLDEVERTALIRRFCFKLQRELSEDEVDVHVSPNFFFVRMHHNYRKKAIAAPHL